MHWRLQRYLVEETVKLTRRFFRYNTGWNNKDIEIVQFSSGSEQLVFEQFFEENERYPVITVGTNGGTLSNAAFNNMVREVADDGVVFGTRAQSMVTITDTSILAAQVPIAALTENYHSIRLYYAWDGNRTGGDLVTANLYSNYRSGSVLVASASLPGSTSESFAYGYAELWPSGSLSGSDYWVTFQTASGSSYNVAIDTDATTLYTSGGSTVTGSVKGALYFPPFMRMGGNFDSTITVKVMSKNGSRLATDLSEILAQYFTLAKYAQISRSNTAVNGMALSSLVLGSVSELTEKGIYLKSIRMGAIETRRRGANDIIFIVPITLDLFSEWFQDFPASALKDIDAIIEAMTG